MSVIPYRPPERWLIYDKSAVQEALGRAEEEIRLLQRLPHLRDQAEAWQATQLRREAAGTSRIEGAEFTEAELDQALAEETPADRLNHSQRQARSAERAYRWIAGLDAARPVDETLVLDVHRRIVSGCDDDHCEPGALRRQDHNVTFGTPQHRGAEGGKECARAFAALMEAGRGEFRGHPPLICAHGFHWHLAAMHPFGDGNGRTARAMEAFMMQKAGLRDALFVALSNYYYENNSGYLSALGEVRQENGDLTPFLLFALEGVRQSCGRLADAITEQLRKSLFRDRVNELSSRLISARKRVLTDRQLAWLNYLLDREEAHFNEAFNDMFGYYMNLKKPGSAATRDIAGLLQIGAIRSRGDPPDLILKANLRWPEETSTHEFRRAVERLPQTRLGKKRSPRRRP